MVTSEDKRDVALILVVAILFLFSGLSATTFLDPDEGMYGSIAKEMVETGDWITPRFNGVPYLNKPPLFFWLSALTVYLFGPSEWAVRLWSALPALGTAILVWRLGNSIYGRPAGLLSALIFMSSVGVFRYVRVAATDFLLVFSVTLAMCGFVRATLGQWSTVNRQRGEEGTIDQLRLTNYRSLGPLLFWLGMALGVLSKGLIGVVLPLLIVTLWAVVNSQWSRVNGGGRRTIDDLRLTIDSPVGLLLFLGLTVPWHILAALKNPGFLEFYIWDNQFLRFLNRRAFIEDDVSVGTLAFLVLTLVWFFPWSLFLPAALREGFPRLDAVATLQERLKWVVGLWGFVVLGFFSLASSKLEHYFLPAVPALSLMVGAVWRELMVNRGNGEWRMVNRQWSIVNGQWMRWTLGVSAAGCFLFGLGLLFLSDFLTPRVLMAGLAELNVYYRILQEQGASFPFASVDPFSELMKSLGIVFAIAFPLALVLFHLHKPQASFSMLLGLAGIIAIIVVRVDLLVEPHHSSSPLAEALAGQGSNGFVVHEGPLEYSGGLPLYLGRQVYVLNGRSGSLDFGSRYPEAQTIFLNDGEFARLWQSDKRVFLVTRLPERASVLKRMAPESAHLLGRYGSHWLYTKKSESVLNPYYK